MENVKLSEPSAIDKAIYKIIASQNGGSELRKTIIHILQRNFSPHLVTKMINGNARLRSDQLVKLHQLLQEFDKSNLITIEDLL